MANNTVEILTSINKQVSTIASYLAPKNGGGKEATSKLSKGNLASTDDIGGSKAMKTDVSSKSLGEFVKMIGGLPKSVSEVAGLSGKTISNFREAMDEVFNVVNEIGKAGFDSKNSKACVEFLTKIGDVPDAVSKFSKVSTKSTERMFNTMTSIFGVFSNMSGAKIDSKTVNECMDAIGKISGMKGIAEALKSMDKISEKSVKNFEKLMESMTKVMVSISKNGKKIDAKSVDSYIKNVERISALNKTISKSALFAPTAFAGALLTYPVVLAYIGIFKMINLFGGGHRTVKNARSMAKAVKQITRLMIESTILLGMCIGLGAIVAKGGSKLIFAGLGVLGATLVTFTIIIGLVGLAGKLLKNVGAIKGVKEITHLTLLSIGIVAACLALGAMISNKNTQKILINGLIVLGGTLVTLGAIILLTGFLGKVIKKSGAVKSVKEIMILTFATIGIVAICLALGYLLTKGDTKKILINGFLILGGTLVTLGVLILLTGLLGNVIKKTGAMKSVREIILLTFGAMAIVLASALLGEFAIKNHENILIGLGCTLGVMIALVGIGFAAGKLLKSAKQGIIALAVIELLALGAVGLMFLVSKLSKDLEGRYDQVIYTLLMTTATILVFGGLAAAASFIMPEILGGSLALGMALLMAYGAVKLIEAILELGKKKEEFGTTWEQLLTDVLGINAVIAAFGLTAAAFSLLTLPILVALPAMALTLAFAKGVIDVTNSIIDIAVRIDEVGGIQRIDDLMNNDIPKMLKGFNKKNFDIELSLMDVAKLTAKYFAVARLSKHLLDTASVISKIANLGTMTEGGQIKPILSIDKENGKIVYGDAVDIVGVAHVICDTLKVFVNSMNYTFDDLKKMIIGAAMFKVLGIITTPISKFLDMLTGFVGGTNGAGDFTLTPVRIDDEGKITYGAAVPVKDTAVTIVNAISAFVSELYSEENAGRWSEMVYGDRTEWQKFWGKTNTKTKAVKEIAGMLGIFLTPVSEFVDTLAQFKSAGPGMLTRVIVDSNGNIKSGETIDVNAVARTIGGTITAFVSEVYNMQIIDDFDDKNEQIEAISAQVTNIAQTFGNLCKNKDIDLDKLSNMYKNFNTGSKSIRYAAESVSLLDKAINAEKDKRNRNIRELGDAIGNLMEKFKDEGDSLRNLYGLVNALNSMDSNRISQAISQIKGAAASAGSAPQATNNNSSPSSSPISSTRFPSITQKQIESAIANALDGMHLTGGSTYEGDVTDEGMNALLNALKSLTIQIDTNR